MSSAAGGRAETPPYTVVIPARYASTRLPGKPLVKLAGRELVLHVLDRARESAGDEVVVAVDDERIAEAVRSDGGEAVLTADTHESGTDRLAEVAKLRQWPDERILINLQGDEPLIPGALLDDLARALHRSGADIATLATPIRDSGDLFDPNVVKVVCAADGFALYFSRAPIPWSRRDFPLQAGAPIPADRTHLRHLGLYAYRAGVVQKLAASPVAAIERAESLEQLRALAIGLRIFVAAIDEPPGHGVDTPEDARRVAAALGA